MRWLWLVAVLSGCQFRHGGLQPGQADASPDAVDAEPDVAIDAFDPLCFGRSPFTVCLAAVPSGDLVLPVNTNINTTVSSSGKCNSDGAVVRSINGVDVCVVSGVTITTMTALGTFGTLPLVLVASDSITINGLVDATATNGGSGGPGMNPAVCAPTTVQGGRDAAVGGGGGAGGSFGSTGGDGGSGAAGAAMQGTALTAVQPPVTTLRGGCQGGQGGLGTGVAHARGGDGGGAIYLVARNTITISGTVAASGGGGLGGASIGGGAGGGSGGMIILAAPMLVIDPSSRIVANGGGGGGGANTTTDGGNGANASTSLTSASGGTAGAAASGGGSGGADVGPGASSSAAAAGGGGGGGGVGVIRVFTSEAPSTGMFSPPPT